MLTLHAFPVSAGSLLLRPVALPPQLQGLRAASSGRSPAPVGRQRGRVSGPTLHQSVSLNPPNRSPSLPTTGSDLLKPSKPHLHRNLLRAGTPVYATCSVVCAYQGADLRHSQHGILGRRGRHRRAGGRGFHGASAPAGAGPRGVHGSHGGEQGPCLLLSATHNTARF